MKQDALRIQCIFPKNGEDAQQLVFQSFLLYLRCFLDSGYQFHV